MFYTIQACPPLPSMSLAMLLKTLISQREKKTPEEITVEYIRERRKALLYPNLIYDRASKLGGHISEGRLFFSHDELKRLEDKVTAALEKI